MGEKRILDSLYELRGLPPEEAAAEMIRRIEAWCPETNPQDDVTLLYIDCL